MSESLYAAADQALSAIAQALRSAYAEAEGAQEVLDRLVQQDVSEQAFRAPRAARLAACRHLPDTVGAAIVVDSALAAAIAGLEDELHWRQTTGYSDAAMGQPGFMDNYAHAEIIGPHGCFAGDDFRLGFLLLGPGLHYLDHYHAAPELYWLLTGPSDWKRGANGFLTRQAGEMIWHRPHVVHATCTHDRPLLALWVWTRDVSEPVKLVGG
ncbi:MAG TPA: dimethylsulfonioproprionate lyase family protein [Aestuariivirgaceae bacterium]|nr:dimethylsulfonioproprionate lyase family protein [Aestuariivirgaceae bacterium]